MTKRILLIDSDESFAQGLSAAMNARGFAATMATNSEQGMTLARQESPDLIIVCVEAQPTNGYMLCTRLKKDEQLKGIPVILTSANATADSFEKHKKLKTRAEEYLIKPFEPQVMLEKASALLGVPLQPEGPPEAPADSEEIVSIEDEPLGLGDLVSGEDEPIHLSEEEVAQAHAGIEDSVVVEEVEDLTDQPPDDSGDDDLKMFDEAFDALGGPARAASGHTPDTERFAGLHAVPEHEEATEPAPGSYEEHASPQHTQLTAPDDEAVLHDEAAPEPHDEHVADAYEAQAALEARVAELEGLLASRDAELENAKRSSASSGETLKLKEAKNRSDKEVLRLKEQLHARETELVELQEQQTSLEGQAQQLKDDSVKREAAAKALQQRADALAAAAKKFERELVSSREELKQVAGLKGKAVELEKMQAAHDLLQKRHAEIQADAEKHMAKAGDLETELEGTREVHGEQLAAAQAEADEAKKGHAAAQAEADEAKEGHAAAQAEADEAKKGYAAAQVDLSKHADGLQQTRGELDAARGELDAARGELATTRHELEGLRAEQETLRTDVATLTGEKDLLGEEREELRRQVEEAQAQATQNEDRAVKAYQKIKSDEKLREKTRKALQIALQLLDEDATSSDDSAHPEKQSA